MKSSLIIGSTTVDITLQVPKLPVIGQDLHIQTQAMALGGCAYNVAEILRHFQLPHILFSPVGTGLYGEMVRTELKHKGIPLLLPVTEENGCCYCFVEASGERTFLSCHGAEYRFQKEWFAQLDPANIENVFVCGLELEESTGQAILDFLLAHPELTVYFAPGPRLTEIAPERMQQIFSLSPILHLNAKEALAFTGLPSGKNEPDRSILLQAAQILSQHTNNHVIITLGADGAILLEHSGLYSHFPGLKAIQIDTNGAGDSHFGAIIANTMLGKTLSESIRIANTIAAAMVETSGASLSEETFAALNLL